MALRNGTRRADVLVGTDGDDVFTPGQGNDVMTGGAGHDTFVFRRADFRGGELARDKITDFTVGEDTIVFAGGGVHWSTGRYFEDYSDSILDGLRIDAYTDDGRHLIVDLVGVLDYFQLPPGTLS